MIKRFKDFWDTQVFMLILVDSLEDLNELAEVFVSIGRERLVYEVYKDEITAYMVEIRMPYNRYLAMMKGLIKRGYNLKPETRVDLINRLIKE